MCSRGWLATGALLLLLTALAPPVRADMASDRLREAANFARQSAWDAAIAALPPDEALDRSHLPLVWEAASALSTERPAATVHLLAIMRRLQPDAPRPRIAMETLWAQHPALETLNAGDLPYLPVNTESMTLPAASGVPVSAGLPATTIVTVAPKPFVAVPPAVESRHGYTFPYLLTVYVADRGILSLRFTVRTVGETDVPLARSLGRFLAALDVLSGRMLGAADRATFPMTVWIWPGGKPGAEQWEKSILFHRTDLSRSGLEWVREAAHEWGHASIPGVDGFSAPEAWANGDLGERLYLPAMARAGWLMAWGRNLNVRAYEERYATPLREAFARTGPRLSLLTDTSQRGFDNFLGAALYVADTYGADVLAAALNDMDGVSPHDFLLALYRVLDRRASWTVTRPPDATGPRPICIPSAGQYILEGSPARRDGRVLTGSEPFPAGWMMVEWTGTLTVRRAPASVESAP